MTCRVAVNARCVLNRPFVDQGESPESAVDGGIKRGPALCAAMQERRAQGQWQPELVAPDRGRSIAASLRSGTATLVVTARR